VANKSHIVYAPCSLITCTPALFEYTYQYTSFTNKREKTLVNILHRPPPSSLYCLILKLICIQDFETSHVRTGALGLATIAGIARLIFSKVGVDASVVAFAGKVPHQRQLFGYEL
jgi:branched-subunit amino acid transport protein AzlD